MGEIRELNRDYISLFNRNVCFKTLNIMDIYNLNAIFRQPRSEPFIGGGFCVIVSSNSGGS